MLYAQYWENNNNNKKQKTEKWKHMLHMVVRTEINESLILSQSRAESVLDAQIRVDWLGLGRRVGRRVQSEKIKS